VISRDGKLLGGTYGGGRTGASLSPPKEKDEKGRQDHRDVREGICYFVLFEEIVGTENTISTQERKKPGNSTRGKPEGTGLLR